MGHLGNVFITGATGLLGSELVSQLKQSKDCGQIVCLIRDEIPQSRFYTEGFNRSVVQVRGDLRDGKLLNRVLNEYEIQTVFHLAAQTLVVQANRNPEETLDVNIRGTWQLLEAIRLQQGRIKASVIASSDKAYGNLLGESYDESFALRGDHPYDVSKSCADLLSRSYALSYDLNIGITRCGNFFGPGDLNSNRIFPSTILSLINKKPPVIRSNGQFIRDYIYVADGAAAYVTLAKKMTDTTKWKGEAFNFSYGLRLSVLDVVAAIQKEMNLDITPQILNQASNEIPVQCLNSDKAKRELSWEPLFGFDEGVKKTVAWYREMFPTGEIK